METIKVRCNSCHRMLSFPTEQIGHPYRCQWCAAEGVVPAGASTPPPKREQLRWDNDPPDDEPQSEANVHAPVAFRGRVVIGVVVLVAAAGLCWFGHAHPEYKVIIAVIGVAAGVGLIFPGSFVGNLVIGAIIMVGGLIAMLASGFDYLYQIGVATVVFVPLLGWTIFGFVRAAPFRLWRQVGRQGSKDIYEVRTVEGKVAILGWFLYFLAAAAVYLFLCTLTLDDVHRLYKLVF